MSKKPEPLEKYAERTAPPPPGGEHTVRLADRGDGWRVLGLVSDTHLGSKHERLDVLEKLYTLFAEEGVKHVFHGGNWVEGESRFNRHDIKVFGLEAQLRYFIDNYPARDGIATYYVAGDDHEGWWQQREVLNIGQMLEDKARAAGRTDLHYLGYVEADVELKAKRGSSVMRVMHGGGGATYAYSYVLQKTVESFQGGEKPAVCVVGHHHKWDYCFPRSVHAILPGCVCDQSIFMRKKKIEAHVGGVLAWIKQSPDGAITRFRAEFVPFFDRGYYERRYDT
jgi:predicted phosphodiesterase